MSRIAVGAWRSAQSDPMQVVSGPIGREKVHYEGPEASRLDREMRAFLEWYNRPDGTDPVVKAGVAHLWFVTIHPFEDGNGRIARAIADQMLARSERSPQRFYSMSAQIRRSGAPITTFSNRSRRAISTLPPGWSGFLPASTGRLTAPKRSWPQS